MFSLCLCCQKFNNQNKKLKQKSKFHKIASSYIQYKPPKKGKIQIQKFYLF